MKIDVVGEIGWDFTDTDFINEVKAKADGDTIEIMVNSPGGSFFAGFAMYEFLKERPEKVKVTVTGYALSAAMYLVLAADELEVGEDALFMLHRVWSILIGNTKEFSDEAKILGLFDSVMFGILSRETGRSLEDLQNEIDTAPGGELWYKGGELLNKLFRNKIEDDPASGASQKCEP